MLLPDQQFHNCPGVGSEGAPLKACRDTAICCQWHGQWLTAEFFNDERRKKMKRQKDVKRIVVCVLCAVAVVVLSAGALAAGPYYGTSPCSFCGATARWMDPGVQGFPQSHFVNGLFCKYTHWVGYQGLLCLTCGALLQEVPVDYETGHNHSVPVQPGQKAPDVHD